MRAGLLSAEEFRALCWSPDDSQCRADVAVILSSPNISEFRLRNETLQRHAREAAVALVVRRARSEAEAAFDSAAHNMSAKDVEQREYWIMKIMRDMRPPPSVTVLARAAKRKALRITRQASVAAVKRAAPLTPDSLAKALFKGRSEDSGFKKNNRHVPMFAEPARPSAWMASCPMQFCAMQWSEIDRWNESIA